MIILIMIITIMIIHITNNYSTNNEHDSTNTTYYSTEHIIVLMIAHNMYI